MTTGYYEIDYTPGITINSNLQLGSNVSFNLDGTFNLDGNPGSYGHILVSMGANVAPTWMSMSSSTLANNSIILGTSSLVLGSTIPSLVGLTNLGIGTSSPQGKFDVLGADDTAVYLRNATAAIRFRPYIPSVGFSQISAMNGALNTYAQLNIGGSVTVLETGGAERMRIDSSGNVGIGTSNPYSAGGYGNLTLNGTTGGILSFRANNTTETFRIQSTTGSTQIGTQTALPIQVMINASEVMRIDSSGNVGIGTSTTTADKLTISAGSGGGLTVDAYYPTITLSNGGTALCKILSGVPGAPGLTVNSSREVTFNTGSLTSPTGFAQLGPNGGINIGYSAVNMYSIPANGAIIAGNVGIGYSNPSAYGTLAVNGSGYFSGALTSASLTLGTPLGLSSGGTGVTNLPDLRTEIYPGSPTPGYVLTTGGAGFFYWAAQTGGGSTPGTTINSTSSVTAATANQVAFTTPTYVPGANQLRVYINGVRQFPTEYVETNSTTVTLNNGCVAGAKVFLQVDGYINNPYTSSTVSFAAPFSGISSGQNTVQLAIQDLEIRKATIADPSFTGTVTANNTSYTGTLTGGTGILNIGSGQVYKDASGNVGIGTSSPYPNSLTLSGNTYPVMGSDGSFLGGGVYWDSGWKNTVASQGGWAIRNTSGVFTLYTGTNAGIAGSISADFGERLRVDNTGRVTMPYQPAFNATTTTSNASGTDITYTSAVFDIGSNLNLGTGRFTAPVAGTYFFRYHQLANYAAAGEYRTAIYVNGAGYGGLRFITQKAANVWWTLIAEGHVKLAVNDYVTIRFESGPGAMYTDDRFASFTGHLIG